MAPTVHIIGGGLAGSEAAWQAAAAGVPVSDVTIDYWLECDGSRQSDYESVCTSGQTYARWVTVSVRGTFTPMFRSKYYPRANSDGTFTITGKTGMRTQ